MHIDTLIDTVREAVKTSVDKAIEKEKGNKKAHFAIIMNFETFDKLSSSIAGSRSSSLVDLFGCKIYTDDMFGEDEWGILTLEL